MAVVMKLKTLVVQGLEPELAVVAVTVVVVVAFVWEVEGSQASADACPETVAAFAAERRRRQS